MHQQCFSKVLINLKKDVLAAKPYLDDIIIASTMFEQHLEDLKKIFQPLKNHGIQAKLQKCKFCKKNIIYLGHQINKEG